MDETAPATNGGRVDRQARPAGEGRGEHDPSAERILAAAAVVLRHSGARGIGMREIARQAGVAVGTLYHHYPDKEALLRAVQERAAVELNRRLQLERLNPGRSLRDRLQAMAGVAFQLAPLFAELAPLVERLQPGLRWILADAHQRGELPASAVGSDNDLNELARLLALVLGASARGIRQVDGWAIDGPARESAVGRLANILSAGLVHEAGGS